MQLAVVRSSFGVSFAASHRSMLVGVIRIMLGVVPLQVPKGHVWLEGDCPHVSRDSREYGPVPLSLIYGRAWFQV